MLIYHAPCYQSLVLRTVVVDAGALMNGFFSSLIEAQKQSVDKFLLVKIKRE